MKYETAVRALDQIHSGAFTRFEYTAELPVKASARERGYEVRKVVATTVRFGITYRNIGSVIQEGVKHTSCNSTYPIHSVIRNKIYKNDKTDELYVRAYPTRKGTNTKVTYLVYKDGRQIWYIPEDDVNSMDRLKELVINSYWNTSYRPVYLVKLKNVQRIGDNYCFDD